MGVLGETLGGVHTLEHGGKTYHVRLIDQGVKLDYERALFAKAKEVALAMRDLMSPEEYRQHLKQLGDDYLAGQYGMDSQRGVESIKTTHGAVTLVSLLFGCDRHEAVQLITQKRDEVTALLDVVLRESFPAAALPQGTAEGEGTAEKK